MRSYLARAPFWVAVVIQTVVFGVIWTVGTAVQNQRFGARSLIAGAVVAVMYGVVMSLTARRQRRRTDLIAGGLTAVQRHAASRAAATGVPPDDPAVRAAAVAMARDALVEHNRTRTMAIVVIAGFAVLSALVAIDSWWYLAGTAVFIVALVWTVRYPAGLRKRIAALDIGGRQGAQFPA